MCENVETYCETNLYNFINLKQISRRDYAQLQNLHKKIKTIWFHKVSIIGLILIISFILIRIRRNRNTHIGIITETIIISLLLFQIIIKSIFGYYQVFN